MHKQLLTTPLTLQIYAKYLYPIPHTQNTLGGPQKLLNITHDYQLCSTLQSLIKQGVLFWNPILDNVIPPSHIWTAQYA